MIICYYKTNSNLTSTIINLQAPLHWLVKSNFISILDTQYTNSNDKPESVKLIYFDIFKNLKFILNIFSTKIFGKHLKFSFVIMQT